MLARRRELPLPCGAQRGGGQITSLGQHLRAGHVACFVNKHPHVHWPSLGAVPRGFYRRDFWIGVGGINAPVLWPRCPRSCAAHAGTLQGAALHSSLQSRVAARRFTLDGKTAAILGSVLATPSSGGGSISRATVRAAATGAGTAILCKGVFAGLALGVAIGLVTTGARQVHWSPPAELRRARCPRFAEPVPEATALRVGWLSPRQPDEPAPGFPKRRDRL